MSRGDTVEQCAKNIDAQLKEKGFERGYYQAEWRDFGKNQEIEYNDRDCMLAVLDALINQGGVAAWAGDGTGCVTQMIQYAYKQRDYWRERAIKAEQDYECLKLDTKDIREKAAMYDGLCD